FAGRASASHTGLRGKKASADSPTAAPSAVEEPQPSSSTANAIGNRRRHAQIK
ncbi:hypothetical protein HUK80_16495, partial [Flavobacterium sp. MAH-1]|nr:hypothetical protein [Flavobacterium agri]NYA72531.1 hypothetical protein [Flavobacterium agri]